MRRIDGCRLRVSVALFAVALTVWTLSLSAETDFTVAPGRAPLPLATALGPDGNVWFAEGWGEKVGKITPAGVITEYPISASQYMTGITAGPDGNIWFTDQLAGKIGRIATDGTGLVQFALPTPNAHPQGITGGPDGNLWFVDQIQSGLATNGFKIGKITVTGQITEYNTNINSGVFQSTGNAAMITTGPDGNLWFTNSQAGAVGRNFVGKITTSGVITIYHTGDTPIAIVKGPDGNLWVTENSHVAKITTSGVETEYSLTGGGWLGITVGSDGNIWFNEARTVGFVTPSGIVTEFPEANYFPSMFYLYGIITGSDGGLWMLGDITSNIGRLNTSGALTNLYELNPGSQPVWSTLGPDGATWVSQVYVNAVSRITTDGAVTTFPTSEYSWPEGITAGPDGNLWFVEQGTFNVAKMTTSGTILAEYPVGYGLWSITVGPDGNLWFPEYYGVSNSIARLTTDGSLTEFPVPTANAVPLFITVGPDGNLWFTENATSKVGKVNPSTGQITEYSPFGTNQRGLGVITAGPDGNLWVMENTSFGAIAKISTSGVLLAEYAAQVQNFPEGLIVGSDGALWFMQAYPNSVGRLTTSGVLSTVALGLPNAVGNDLSVGADGKLWMVESAAGAVGRMSAIGGTGDTINATHGTQFNGAVASFVDGTPTASPSNFTATINWGDGVRTAGTVSGPTGGPFVVSGTHTYPAPGMYTLAITLTDSVDNASYQATPGTAQVN